MIKTIDTAGMSNLELTERYYSARLELQSLCDEIRKAELAYSSKPSSALQDRLRAARMAFNECSNTDPYRLEIIRRLNAPLKSARLAKGLSQGELAKRAGWSRNRLQAMESGKFRANVQMALRIWNVLGLEYPKEWDSLDFC